MALASYNATLEYATNTIEFWLYDDANAPVSFNANTKLSIERLDDSSMFQEFVGSVSGNKVTFTVNPLESVLYKTGDDLYSYDDPKYEHIYSVKADGVETYLMGKLNLVKVA